MGDGRVQDRAEQVQDTNTQDASSRLRDDAFGTMKRAGNDRTTDNGGGQPALESNNPYFHVQMAGMALREFEGLKGKDSSAKVTISDDQGNTREVTIGERRAQLLQIADTEFKAGVAAADRIDQSKIPDKLLEIRYQQNQAPDLKRLQELTQLESTVESMKHAPGCARFAYATFLADRGDMQQAQKYLNEVGQLDPEARLDDTYREFCARVETGLKAASDQSSQGGSKSLESQVAIGDGLAAAFTAIDEKTKSGDKAGVEAEYKKAIALADQVDQVQALAQLQAIDQAKKDNAGNADALKQLDEAEKAWAGLLHAPAITKMKYAEFLVGEKRFDEAKPLLDTAAKQDPDLTKENSEFTQLAYAANHQGKQAQPFDNPYAHLQKVEDALNAKDLDGARKELMAAIKAADETVDRKQMQTDKRNIDDVLKETTPAAMRAKLQKYPNLREALKDKPDSELRAELGKVREYYDAFDHASAFCRVALARFEIANKNFNQANTLITDIERFDPELTKKPELEWDKLKQAAQEPSTWEKAWGFTKDVLKELACDAVAVLAGVGAGLGVGALTSLSGPGAVVAGGAAGAAAGAGAYTFMKCVVFGEEFHWSMPLWGALDGASGGVSAAVRTGLVKVGGRIVTKEFAEATVLKAGGNVAALEGLEGLKMAQTAQTLTKDGLKVMAKDMALSRGTRLASAIPFLNTGNAEYRAALSAYRGLAWANRGVSAGINIGTAASGSLIYRGGTEGAKYANGDYKSFGDFAKGYGMAVVTDSVTGATITGRSTGTALNSLWAGSSVRAWELGLGSMSAVGQYETTQKALEDLQKPATPDEASRRMYYMPGTNKYPYSK